MYSGSFLTFTCMSAYKLQLEISVQDYIWDITNG